MQLNHIIWLLIPGGMWRSLVAHLTGGQVVAGSNPVIPTRKKASKVLTLGAFFLHKIRFIPDTSFTLYTGDIVYTFINEVVYIK